MSMIDQELSNDFKLVVQSNGKKNFSLVKDEAYCTAFKVRNRFQFFEGEWFVDTRLGVPYFRYIYVKNPNEAVVRRIFRKLIMSTPGIISMQPLVLTLDRTKRALAVSFSAQATTNRTITGGTHAPFLIDGKDLSGATNNASLSPQ